MLAGKSINRLRQVTQRVLEGNREDTAWGLSHLIPHVHGLPAAIGIPTRLPQHADECWHVHEAVVVRLQSVTRCNAASAGVGWRSIWSI